ncbi:MAG: hypothetical protein DME14_06060 [Candidatus Rokuibacteriota bacterium]|nr:MAG: hypothetical protein DME14_06060 [Candidatus Rokubacteria bacterium]
MHRRGDRWLVYDVVIEGISLVANYRSHPVDYRMHRRGDRWLVYDVVIEGISLVANYRSQFNAIIQTSTYQDLVARMKTKAVSVAESVKE